MSEFFHSERSAWGRIKHVILQNYIPLYVGKLGYSNEQIFYIDGFAGQAIYGNNEPGSAFIGAQAALFPTQKSRAGKLHCINVEENEETFRRLDANLADHVKLGRVTNLPGAFHKNLPSILTKIGRAPAFFFIDPFGSQGVEIGTLKQIRAGRDSAEVLVRYDDTRVKRLASWAANNLDHEDEGHRKSALNFARRVLQLTDEQALIESAAIDDKQQTREILLEGYINAVKANAGFKYALSYQIRNPLTNGHKYYLVHFSNHPDGYVYMAHFMARAEREYEEDRRRRTEEMSFGEVANQEVMPGIFEDADRAADNTRVAFLTAKLPAIIEACAKNGRECQLRWLFKSIVDGCGYSYTRSEWVRALGNAKKNGLLSYSGTEDSSIVTFH